MNLLATRETAFLTPPSTITVAKTVLVVEDERIVREATCQVLRELDYCVLAAENAAIARRMLLDHLRDIDLLLCDAVLPDEDGRALAHDLCGASPGLRVVLVSGYPQPEISGPEVSESESSKPDMNFLTKPYSAESLVLRIRGVLNETATARL
jgi:DNA-binding NtrC family response regulator